MVTPSEIC